jgi:ADP-glucose type glycogen/starch synthase
MVPQRDGIGEAGLATMRYRDVTVSFVIADEHFDRDGLYGGAHGDFPDNAARFAFFAHAVAALAARLDPPPDVVHCHDWQTGLVPALVRTAADPRLARVPTVITIHNLGYQGRFGPDAATLLGLDPPFRAALPRVLRRGELLKAGLVFADRLTTVSPRYAEEIQTPEHGHGLDGVLRERRAVLRGILNGIDAERWDPACDPVLAARYDADHLAGKAECKATLQRDYGLPIRARVPLFGMVTRLAEQKGLDILAAPCRSFSPRTSRSSSSAVATNATSGGSPTPGTVTRRG